MGNSGSWMGPGPHGAGFGLGESGHQPGIGAHCCPLASIHGT
jgi:hypothetical protein